MPQTPLIQIVMTLDLPCSRIDLKSRQRYTPPPARECTKALRQNAIREPGTMSAQPETACILHSQVEQIREGRGIIQQEAEALATLAQQLDSGFARGADLLFRSTGCVIVTGMGKAGIIGQKIAATL